MDWSTAAAVCRKGSRFMYQSILNSNEIDDGEADIYKGEMLQILYTKQC